MRFVISSPVYSSALKAIFQIAMGAMAMAVVRSSGRNDDTINSFSKRKALTPVSLIPPSRNETFSADRFFPNQLFKDRRPEEDDIIASTQSFYFCFFRNSIEILQLLAFNIILSMVSAILKVSFLSVPLREKTNFVF